MRKALVIGAGGFIGSRLVVLLRQSGVHITATTRGKCVIRDADETLGGVDVADRVAIAAVFAGREFDVVYHLAALTEHQRLVGDPLASLDAHVSATINVVSAFAQSPSRRIVFSSTGKVYGPVSGRGIHENDVRAPTNVLGRVKMLAEDVLLYVSRAVPTKQFVLARIFNVWGPDQKDTFILPTILRQLQKGPVLQLGNLDDGRDYTHVEDIARALLLFGGRSSIRQSDIYNVGSGHAHTVRDILQEVALQTGTVPIVQQDPRKTRSDEHSCEFADTTKLSALGWAPRISFASGIADVIRSNYPDLLS